MVYSPTSVLKLTPRTRAGVHKILRAVTYEQTALDQAYSQHFYTEDYSSTEQASIAQLTGALLRKLNLYAYILNCSSTELTQCMDTLLYVWCFIHSQSVPSFLNLQDKDVQAIHRRWEMAQTQSALLDGCPDWLDQIGQEQLGKKWPSEREALAMSAKRFIRANHLKITTAELQIALKKEAIEARPVPTVRSALEVLSDCALFKTRAFQEGLFEQQDAGSQLIIEALDVQPGMRVIDACAGAGGKTLGLAALMKGKGRLLAMDIEEHKLDALKKRAKRAGADNIETRWIASSKIVKRQQDSADRLLLDVPCSGFGVLKRNPEAKWHQVHPQDLNALVLRQREILTRYSKMLKPDGIMVYSTCSIFPMENQEQVAHFLSNHPQFRLEAEATISPAETGFDGFYWAKLKRVEG